MLTPMWRGRIAAALAIGGLFFVFAGDGIRGYFTPDDMMNLDGAWSASLAGVLRENRPVGQLLYRAVFAVAGLNPLPFRIVAFGLLLANLLLLYRFCLRLSESREVAVLACLLGAYHAHLADLYYSTGTYYELLCWFFLFGFLVYYFSIRAAGRYPDWRENVLLLGLYALALGSKEMAVVAPMYVLAYEALFQKHLGTWLRRGAWFWWLCLPLTALYAASKLWGPSAMTVNPDFAPHFSVHAFFNASRHYLGDLFYGAIAFNTTKIVLLFAAMLALAIYTRRRDLLFAWVVAVLGVLPVIFSEPRGFYVMYLTMPGWYLFSAAALVMGRDTILRRLPSWAAAFDARPEQAALFVALLLVLIPVDRYRKPIGNSWVAGDYQSIRSVLEPLNHSAPLRHGGRVLFLSDPFDPGDWILSHMFRLHYRDASITVDRVKDHPELAARAAEYDRVYTLDGAGLQRIR